MGYARLARAHRAETREGARGTRAGSLPRAVRLHQRARRLARGVRGRLAPQVRKSSVKVPCLQSKLDDRAWCWRLVRPRTVVSRGTPRLKCVYQDNMVVLQMLGSRAGTRCRARGRGRVSDARAGRGSRSDQNSDQDFGSFSRARERPRRALERAKAV